MIKIIFFSSSIKASGVHGTHTPLRDLAAWIAPGSLPECNGSLGPPVTLSPVVVAEHHGGTSSSLAQWKRFLVCTRPGGLDTESVAELLINKRKYGCMSTIYRKKIEKRQLILLFSYRSFAPSCWRFMPEASNWRKTVSRGGREDLVGSWSGD